MICGSFHHEGRFRSRDNDVGNSIYDICAMIICLYHPEKLVENCCSLQRDDPLFRVLGRLEKSGLGRAKSL